MARRTRRTRRTRRNTLAAEPANEQLHQFGYRWGEAILKSLKAQGHAVGHAKKQLSNIILGKPNAQISLSSVSIPSAYRGGDAAEVRKRLAKYYRAGGWAGNPVREGVEEAWAEAQDAKKAEQAAKKAKKPKKGKKTTTSRRERREARETSIPSLDELFGEGTQAEAEDTGSWWGGAAKEPEAEAEIAAALLSGDMTLAQLCAKLDTVSNPSRRRNGKRGQEIPRAYQSRHAKSKKKKSVPKHMKRTARWEADALYVYPSTQSFPIGDLYHAKLALVPYLLSPSLASRRRRVLTAVEAAYPAYNWKAFWNAEVRKYNKKHPRRKIGTWNQIVNRPGLRSNARRPRRTHITSPQESARMRRDEKFPHPDPALDRKRLEEGKPRLTRDEYEVAYAAYMDRIGDHPTGTQSPENIASEKKRKKAALSRIRLEKEAQTDPDRVIRRRLAPIPTPPETENRRRRRRLNPYQKFMGKHMRKGKSMKQAAALWRRRR